MLLSSVSNNYKVWASRFFYFSHFTQLILTLWVLAQVRGIAYANSDFKREVGILT